MYPAPVDFQTGKREKKDKREKTQKDITEIYIKYI